MKDITELESRITAALDRIGQGLETLAKPATEPEPAPGQDEAQEEVRRLEQALDEEKVANEQLEERVKAIREKQDGIVTSLREEVAHLRGLLDGEETQLARFRNVNAGLRANNDALRTALSEGLSEPHLVNKSMMAELDALRTTQASDRAELDTVLGELAPLVRAAEEGQPDA